MLEVEPGKLAALGAAGAADVRALREQVADRLFDADREHFERIGAIAARIPVAVSAQLAPVDRRGEWIAMAAFVGHLDPAVLRPTLAELSVEGLLRTGYVIDDSDVLDAIVDELDDDRPVAGGPARRPHDGGRRAPAAHRAASPAALRPVLLVPSVAGAVARAIRRRRRAP